MAFACACACVDEQFDQVSFYQALSLAAPYNRLVDLVARDVRWLYQALERCVIHFLLK